MVDTQNGWPVSMLDRIENILCNYDGKPMTDCVRVQIERYLNLIVALYQSAGSLTERARVDSDDTGGKWQFEISDADKPCIVIDVNGYTAESAADRLRELRARMH